LPKILLEEIELCLFLYFWLLFSLLNLYSQYIALTKYLDVCLKSISTNWTQDIEKEKNTFEDIIVVYTYNSNLINNFFFQKLKKFLKIRVANIRIVVICLFDNIANRYILTN